MKTPTKTYVLSFNGRNLIDLNACTDSDLLRFGTRIVLDADKEFVEEYRPRDLDRLPKIEPETITVGKILDIKNQVGKRNKFRLMG